MEAVGLSQQQSLRIAELPEDYLVVGVHGRVFVPPHQSYIHHAMPFHFGGALARPWSVHELGTGHAGADNRNCERPCHRFPIPSLLLARGPIGTGYAGRNPACASALRLSSDASASRNACTAGRCLRAVTSAKS